MSFLDRIKASGRSQDQADGASDAAAAPAFEDSSASANPMEATVRLGQSSFASGAAHGDFDSSIISEAVPSELARDSGQPGAVAGGDASSSGLPLIGAWPLARQQRLLVALFALGLLGLLLTAVLTLTAGSRGSVQLAAAGQATTQSQRLAKSVSQALAGDDKAFPAVKESSDALTGNVSSLKAGDAAVPAALQGQLDAVVPLVDRSSKNAAVVLGQQKALVKVGAGAEGHRQAVDRAAGGDRNRRGAQVAGRCRSRRVVGRGPAGDAVPAHRQERQRVTHRREGGRERHAATRRGPELVPHDHAGPARRQRRPAPGGHPRTAGARVPAGPPGAIRVVAHRGGRDSGQPDRPGRGAGRTGRDRRRQRTAAPGPGGPAAEPGGRCRLRRPAAGRRAAVGAAAGRRRLRPAAPVRARPDRVARGWPTRSVSRPSARSRKPSA